MQIFVRDKKLREGIADEALCRKYFGAAMAKKIKLRVEALQAAESLVVFWPPNSGPERCHELKGESTGTFSIDVKQPYRILFVPIESSNDRPADEQERWRAIKAIELLGVKDTHG